MLNMKIILKKALVLALSGYMLSPSISLAMMNNTAGCPIVNFYRQDNGNPLLISQRPQSHIGEIMYLNIPQSGGDIRTVEAGRHHIIPYHVLRDFFNEVIRRSATHPNEIHEFAEGLSHLIDNGYNVYDRGRNRITLNRLQHARALVGGMGRGEISINTVAWSSQELNIAIPALHTMFIWMPGNIFIGPNTNYRFDDPGRGF